MKTLSEGVTHSEKFAPELNTHEHPPIMALKSVHNTTIEGFWRWLREKIGYDIKAHILRGQEDHYFDVATPWHRYVWFRDPYLLHYICVIQGPFLLGVSAACSSQAR